LGGANPTPGRWLQKQHWQQEDIVLELAMIYKFRRVACASSTALWISILVRHADR